MYKHPRLNKLYKEIYARALARGIEIECGPAHRRGDDHIGAGRRVVWFPSKFNDGKKYSREYRDTLLNIGLRLNLISESESNAAQIADGLAALCPKCGRLGSPSIIAEFGCCLNCSAKTD